MRTFRSVVLRGCQSHVVLAISAISLALTGRGFFAPANAQQADEEPIEEIQVVGTRQIIQSNIDIKRNETTIVDGLSAVDIGDLTALLIGEALETVTGVASHREKRQPR